jgi:RNA-splicing ligase RtcB
VIARLNFLFDPENEFFLSADTICDFFGTKKSTVGNKATQIEKACNLGLGAEGLCSPEISDALTLVELPNGLVIPKSMLSKLDIVYEVADEEETKELEKFKAEQQRIKEREAAEKKARRAEINRKIAEDKKKKKKEQDKQLKLFDF